MFLWEIKVLLQREQYHWALIICLLQFVIEKCHAEYLMLNQLVECYLRMNDNNHFSYLKSPFCVYMLELWMEMMR